MPRAILANIFLVSHILLFFHSPEGVISCKIWETRKIFPILHSAPCDNNYISYSVLLNSSMILFLWGSWYIKVLSSCQDKVSCNLIILVQKLDQWFKKKTFFYQKRGIGFMWGCMKCTKWVERTKYSTLSWWNSWVCSSFCVSIIIE